MSRVYILLLVFLSTLIVLGSLSLLKKLPVGTNLKIANSRRVPAYRITESSKLLFSLLPTDEEIDIKTNLEVESVSTSENYTYGVCVEVLRGDQVVLNQVFYKKTRKTILSNNALPYPYEPVFYFGSSLTPADTRSITINLKGNNLPGSYLRISMTPDSNAKSAIVRVGKVVYKDQRERPQGLQSVEDEAFLGEVTEQSEKRVTARVRTVEWLSPEGLPRVDYTQVDLYISTASAPSYNKKLVGTLLGAFQAAIYKAKPGDKIRINGISYDGALLSEGAIEIEPPILEQPLEITEETTYTVKNRLDQPVYIRFETYSEQDEVWATLDPIYSVSGYYLVGPNMRHKIVADILTSPRRVRIVTRAHFTKERGSAEYRVTFRGLNSAGEVVIEDRYTARSTFEPLDRCLPEENFAKDEAVGTRHVAYVYLPANTVTLELDSDRSILVALSTEVDKGRAYLSELYLPLPKLRGMDGVSAPPMTHWFYFRPSNVQELLESNQYRLVATASTPGTLKAVLVGVVPKRLSLKGLDTVSLRPEKSYFVEIFEPITSERRDNRWEANLYTPLDPSATSIDIGDGGQENLRLRYSLEDGLRRPEESPLIVAGEEKVPIAGHTPIGKIRLPDREEVSTLLVVERAATGRYFVNRPSKGSTEVWSERKYFNLLPGEPLSITVEQKRERITGVNVVLRFDRSQTTLATVKLQVTVEAEGGRVVIPSRYYSVKNLEDKQAVLSNRPDQKLSVAQRIFIPLGRLLSPGRYRITVKLLDDVKAFARFFHYTSAPSESPESVNFWVESNNE